MKTVWVTDNIHFFFKEKALREESTLQDQTEKYFELGIIKERERENQVMLVDGIRKER